jgi:hypothetical protein
MIGMQDWRRMQLRSDGRSRRHRRGSPGGHAVWLTGRIGQRTGVSQARQPLGKDIRRPLLGLGHGPGGSTLRQILLLLLGHLIARLGDHQQLFQVS